MQGSENIKNNLKINTLNFEQGSYLHPFPSAVLEELAWVNSRPMNPHFFEDVLPRANYVPRMQAQDSVHW